MSNYFQALQPHYEVIFPQNVSNIVLISWWHGWLVGKALASHQGDPVRFPARAIM